LCLLVSFEAMHQVIFGNAANEDANRWGWFIGHFITPTNDPRSTEDSEVKWGVHKAGDCRSHWGVNEAATLSILINGRFRLQFQAQDVVLSREGDYALWSAGMSHTWLAETDCTIVTVRWPSKL